MMRLLWVLAVAAIVSDGCGGDSPVVPTPTVPPPVVAPPPSAPVASGQFPAIVAPARVFSYRDSPLRRVSEYTLTSRFVLYNDGRFALQYNTPIGEYLGRYMANANGPVTFQWDASIAWTANATLSEGILSVRYNDLMKLTDFEDANYVFEDVSR